MALDASGLQTLFQNMGPTFAATQAGEAVGQQQGLQQLQAQQDQQKVQQMQLQTQQQQAMNPINQAAAQANIGETQARTGLLQGQGASAQAAGATAQAAQPAAQGAAIGGYNLQQQKQALDAQDAQLGYLTRVASSVQNAGPAGAAVIRQAAMQLPDGPLKNGLLAHDPSTLPDAITKANEYLNQSKASYQEQLLKNASASNVEAMRAGSASNVAQINAGSREQVAQEATQRAVQSAMLKQSLQQKLSSLVSAKQQNPNDPNIDAAIAQTQDALQQANAAYGTAINLPALSTGILTRNAQVQPQGQPQNPAAPKVPTGAPNQAQVDYLKANPTLRNAFDQKFGPGASAKILGQ